ncbi:MAG: c-type cytochrome [Gammaproteobacteria bacterium]|nr:c-type cytochrome [Gammaproteobacteria bacterium]
MMIYRTLPALIIALTGLIPICAASSPEKLSTTPAPEANIAHGKKIYALCASCHLKNGWGKVDGSFPVIAGQHQNVLIKQLEDIRSRSRENPTMYPFSDAETIGGEQALLDVTAYIARLPVDPSPGQGSGKQLALGKTIYQQRCTQCHGDNGQGNNEALFPKLRGQHHAYLLRQLKWIRDGYRQNSNPVMVEQTKTLTDVELDAVADYLSRR